MKKLILLLTLTLTMMFGQTKLETRMYEFPIDLTAGETIFDIDMYDLTGYDLPEAVLQFVGLDDYTWFNTVRIVYQCDIILENQFFYFENGGIRNTGTHNYFDDENCYFRSNYTSNDSFNRNMLISITAEFPDMDTGYIEDGFDYCVEPGANLMS
ncbi:MAG: hypothetical protein HOM61_08295, partial [Candidatus Marinimicrobia bacterium]|nr:hypothetical protein [Candidatus Neomarinimicrobiota bacterium]